MGCLAVIFALISPRLALFLTWVLSDRLSIAFSGWLLPVLGFFLLPWTTLAWTFAYAPTGGVSGVGWIVIVVALLVDLGLIGSGRRAQRRRNRRSRR